METKTLEQVMVEKMEALMDIMADATVVPAEMNNGDCYTVTTGEEGEMTFLVLNEEDREYYVTEEIKDRLWAFIPEFLAECTEIEVTPFETMAAQGDETFNNVIKILIENTCGMEYFVEQAVVTDGYGHFLSTYDGDENESGEFFIYRLD